MKYKHKFYLINKEDDTKTELATCSDTMTANFLSDHFRGVYRDDKFEVEYRHKQEKRILPK